MSRPSIVRPPPCSCDLSTAFPSSTGPRRHLASVDVLNRYVGSKYYDFAKGRDSGPMLVDPPRISQVRGRLGRISNNSLGVVLWRRMVCLCPMTLSCIRFETDSKPGDMPLRHCVDLHERPVFAQEITHSSRGCCRYGNRRVGATASLSTSQRAP